MESAPTVVPTKVPVGIPVLLSMISDIQNIILLATKTYNTLEISSHKTKLLQNLTTFFCLANAFLVLPDLDQISAIWCLSAASSMLIKYFTLLQKMLHITATTLFFFSSRKGIFLFTSVSLDHSQSIT